MTNQGAVPGASASKSDPRILCLGEALVDVVKRAGETQTQEHVGGSLLNVACILARLGHQTEFAAWWGKDKRGEAIESYLHDHGVNIVPGSNQAAYTSSAQANLDEMGRAEYLFDLLWDIPPLPNLGSLNHIHTGSIAAVLEPGGSEVLKQVKQMALRGTVSLDPNARPDIMQSPDKVKGRIEELIALSDVIKASDEDVAWLYPDEPVEQVMRRWLAAGPAMVVITRGAWGAYAMLKAERDMIVIDPLNVERGDTVGAGDSFMGGLISGLLEAELLGSGPAKRRLRAAKWADVLPALHRGTITSGLTVSRHGAYAPTSAEVEEVLKGHPELY